MEPFILGNLKILVEMKESMIKFLWTGSSDNRELVNSLDLYYDKLMDQLKGNKLLIDFTKLEAMNSSSIPAIISCIKKLEDNQISTKIIYKKNSNWQKSSFRLLETMSERFNHVKIEGI